MPDFRRSGFSLVELLIVSGIIIVLVSILLPTLGRAHDAAQRVTCQSNLRQLGLAFRMYATNNGDVFPFRASVDEGNTAPFPPEDWIYWQAPRNINQSAILRYTGTNNTAPFVCPSDNVSQRNRVYTWPYPFSYSFNQQFGGDVGNVGYRPIKLAGVHTPSEKILLVEEDPWSIDDGNWNPNLVGTTIENFIAIRHDRRVVNDVSTAPSPLNIDCRGNVCFADGHCEFLIRRDSQNPMYWNPSPLWNGP